AITDQERTTNAQQGGPQVAMPPAPPGESLPAAVDRTRAVSQALVDLGDDADTRTVAEHVQATWGFTLSADDVETIRQELRAHAEPAPPPGEGAAASRG